MPPKKNDEKQNLDTGFVRGIPEIVPVLQLGYSVVFPSSTIPLALEHDDEAPQFLAFLKEAPYCIAQPHAQDDGDGGFPIGVLGCVTRLNESNPEEPAFYFSGLYRVRVTRVESRNGVLMAKHQLFADIPVSAEDAASEKLGSLLSVFRNRFHLMFILLMQKALGEHVRTFFGLPFVQDAMARAKNTDAENLASVIDGIMNALNHAEMVLGGKPIDIRDPSLLVLAEPNVLIRVKYFMQFLDLLFTAAAAKESGSRDEPDEETDALETRYEEIKEKISEEARKEIKKEFSRMRRAQSSEASKAQDHLELLLAMPWGTYTEDRQDLREAGRILNERHTGLDKIKDRILESIAVRQLNPSAKAPILCFVGPPGVGKTSLGQAIADALGRKFIRVSLGGMRDQAFLKGFEGTYISSKEGRIIEAIKRCGSSNPVFMIDEVDKIGEDYKGDPADALLEVLDPEQNNAFWDYYLNVHFDLSQIFFIATANILDPIHPALLDRMEVIELPGYTPLEKLQIAKDHLIPRRRKENGFPIAREGREPLDIAFTDEAILAAVHNYTREAGVRNLEREFDRPFRKIGKAFKFGDIFAENTIQISEENLAQFIGKSSIVEHTVPAILPAGVVPVLAVSNTGGHVFQIEVTQGYHPGGRKITMTGVRDSSQTKDSINKIEESFKDGFDALMWVMKIIFDDVQKYEREVGPFLLTGSMTNGAVPKDGPSAGLSGVGAIYGIITNQSIKPTEATPLLALTGAITKNTLLVCAIGGVRDKILAAHRFGAKRIIIPKENERDIEDIPREILDDIDIKTVRTIPEALHIMYPNDERIRRFIEQQRSS